MNFFFVIKSLSLAGGGAERVLAQVASGLAARGHVVTVATYGSPAIRDFYPMGEKVRRLHLGMGGGSARSRLFQTIQRIRALRVDAKLTSPDVAVGFMHSAYIPLGLALKGSGIPMIASEHTVYSHYAGRPAERLLLRLVPGLAKVTTHVSEDAKNTFPEALRRRTRIIPNPVGPAVGERANVVSKGRKTLLAVGGLREEKGHEVLISAFSLIASGFPEWTLRIVGEGPLRQKLEAQIQGSKLTGRVVLAGATPNVDAEYQRAQLFVMPSSYESFGLATAEALAHGLPAVGFADCSGTNQLIKHGENGLLVAGLGRAQSLASGLTEMMASGEKRVRMGTAAPAQLSAYSPERVIKQWEDLARDVATISAVTHK